MKKTLIPALVLVLASVVLGATVFREQVAWAAPGIQEVFVTNSTREPVPVHEQGTADVNVTNAPLAVRETGETPVQKRLQFAFFGYESEALYTIPAGKYLRIEYVTFDLGPIMPNIRWFRVRTTLGGEEAAHYLPYTTQGARDIVAEPVTIHGQPGSTVRFEIQLTNDVGFDPGHQGSFSGVLIDAP